ncbi:MAG: hypothetical protein VX438_02000 [Planctomycetota bacterium]|nr:hypothetical protein [Planctomycetota bacterium]
MPRISKPNRSGPSSQRGSAGTPKTSKPQRSVRRMLLGGLAVVGLGIYLVDLLSDGTAEVLSQSAFRVGMVLGAMWFAYPQLTQITRSFSSGILVALLLVTFAIAKNPLILVGAILLCLALGLANVLFRPREK